MKKALLMWWVAWLFLPRLAEAHHGVAAVGLAGPEGPGAALETASPLALRPRSLFVMLKDEHVPYKKLAFAEPTNKDSFRFTTLALGYGIAPSLSAYVFQPYSTKTQDGVGTARGIGDPSVMLALAFKYDRGFRLLPEKESLDDLMDWHFAVYASGTIPAGRSDRQTSNGAYFAPDMQNGFGSPSLGAGLAAMKQVADDVTWLAEVSYQSFRDHEYPFARYKFGTESRLNTAVTYRLLARGTFRTDVVGEVSALHLQRDRETANGAMESLAASGGTIGYGSAGLRIYYRSLSAGLSLKKALAKRLNEGAAQQGSEGLEKLRFAATISYSFGL